MKTRAIKSIAKFLETAPPSVYYFDAQFGEIHYVSDQIAANVSARIDACGDVYVVDNTNMADQNAIELPSELKGKKFRIRKLTPKECFRLMGVEDRDIDRMQASGLSNSAQYKLAGNSIVVDVLYHIFRKLLVETQNEDTQPTLF